MQPTLAKLVKWVDEGDLALPEFQRDFRWPLDFMVELLRSIARGWPIGTFLLLEQNGTGVLPARQLESAPRCKAIPNRLILDGQQRMTAIYQALGGKGRFRFYLDMKQLRRDGEFTDESLDGILETQFGRKFGRDMETRAMNHILALDELVSAAAFNEWLNYLPDRERVAYAELKDDHLEELDGYAITTETVSASLPMEAIAKIFERTNRSVLELDAFDLMVAILWGFSRGRFNLRKKWAEAKRAHPLFVDYNIRGLEILKVIALREHMRQHQLYEADKLPRVMVKGVRQSDILAVEPAVVRRNWLAAVQAYANSLAFIRDECGAIRSRLVPQLTMLLPLADVCQSRKKAFSAAQRRKLRRWFWGATFSRQYARGANTRAVSDATALRDWLSAGWNLRM